MTVDEKCFELHFNHLKMVKYNLQVDDVLTIKNNQFSSKEKLSKFSLPRETRDKILAINDHDEQVYRYFGTGFQ